MGRATDARDDRSLETDGGDDSATDSWESTVEVDVTDDRPPRVTPGERATTESAAKQPLGSGDVYCWSCGVPIKSAAEICPQCGVRQQPPPTAEQEKSPEIAALASVVWTGAGQIYNGEIAKGLGLMALFFVSIPLMLVVIGFFMAPFIWVYSIYDAYRTAERSNQQPSHPSHEF